MLPAPLPNDIVLQIPLDIKLVIQSSLIGFIGFGFPPNNFLCLIVSLKILSFELNLIFSDFD